VSRFTSSTYSSMAILLFFPPLRFINLFHTRHSVWLGGRVPDTNAVKCTLPIKYCDDLCQENYWTSNYSDGRFKCHFCDKRMLIQEP
jgi:hypothetical protein